MRSRIVDMSGNSVRRISDFIAKRPWLCGAGVLAAVTAGLFAWFCAQRWDDVDVSASSEATRGAPRVRLLQRDHGHRRFEDGSLAGPESNGRGQEITGPESADGSEFARSADERMRVRHASATVAADQPPRDSDKRGAWLIGTIEEIDDAGFRHAHSGSGWPGLASHPGTAQW